MTLSAVAGERLSVGLLSKLERDLVNPSLETLCYVAGQLGISPGAVLRSENDDTLHAARGALAAARAHLLLADSTSAVTAAITAVASLPSGAPTDLRSRLLAVAADASLAGGNAGQASQYLRDASAPPSAPGAAGNAKESVSDADLTGAQVELAWVLGNLERRRGSLADAARTWARCLAGLEDPPDAHPWWPYLRAGVLAELGGLAEARGDVERARNLVARAASIAAGLAQAAAPAASLLATWARGTSAFDREDAPSAPAAALSLAVVAAAERLGRRLTLEAARLERAAWAPEARARAPDAPASRGLR